MLAPVQPLRLMNHPTFSPYLLFPACAWVFAWPEYCFLIVFFDVQARTWLSACVILVLVSYFLNAVCRRSLSRVVYIMYIMTRCRFHAHKRPFHRSSSLLFSLIVESCDLPHSSHPASTTRVAPPTRGSLHNPRRVQYYARADVSCTHE